MCRLSPTFNQFLTVIICKYNKKKYIVLPFNPLDPIYFPFKGNILTFSFGLSLGWATINLPELQNENSTFPIKHLTKEEAALLVSFHNLGSIFGNFLTIPVSQVIGSKRTIHLLGVPLIVNIDFQITEISII